MRRYRPVWGNVDRKDPVNMCRLRFDLVDDLLAGSCAFLRTCHVFQGCTHRGTAKGRERSKSMSYHSPSITYQYEPVPTGLVFWAPAVVRVRYPCQPAGRSAKRSVYKQHDPNSRRRRIEVLWRNKPLQCVIIAHGGQRTACEYTASTRGLRIRMVCQLRSISSETKF